MAFPGSSFVFSFTDTNTIGMNIESLTTFPNPGLFGTTVRTVESGVLNFGGSYSTGGYDVIWGITSWVRSSDTGRAFSDNYDTWAGTLRAKSRSVPDGGITLMLLGLGLSGLAIGRRFMKAF